jgi:hypothetical protein
MNWRVAYVIGKRTNPNTSAKRHYIDANGKPICNSHTRSFTLEYEDGQVDCKKCMQVASNPQNLGRF